jgi:hypothetical protein
MIHYCEDCHVELNSYNTKGLWRARKPKTLRCGSCYLEWKREIRRVQNET